MGRLEIREKASRSRTSGPCGPSGSSPKAISIRVKAFGANGCLHTTTRHQKDRSDL